MTAPHQIGVNVEDGALPVSSELLSLLSSFSAQVGLIFDELSRNPQQAGSSSSASGDFAQPLTALSELDERLGAVLQRAKVHHANQTRIKQLENQLVQYELDWRKEMLMLEEQRKVLKRLVDAGNKDKAAIERAQKGVLKSGPIQAGSVLMHLFDSQAALKPSTVLSYARMLAPFTSAPPRLKPISGDAPGPPDNAIPPGSILPYPTEETMRRGRLAFAEVGDIGETSAMTGGELHHGILLSTLADNIASQTARTPSDYRTAASCCWRSASRQPSFKKATGSYKSTGRRRRLWL
jgi:hypothetical protein